MICYQDLVFPMSPASNLCKSYRLARNLSQRDAAKLLGYEQSFICAFERGKRGVPTGNFKNVLVSKFALSEEERNQFENALKRSSNKIVLPFTLDEDKFYLAHEFAEHLESLNSKQMELIRLAINIKAKPNEAKTGE